VQPQTGSLTVVGCGILAPAHVTTEGRAHIERAQRVYSLVADPVSEAWIARTNPATISLASYYAPGKPRSLTYDEMAATIAAAVACELRVCAVAYGHPGMFADPLHDAIGRVREAGRPAVMLPGISAEDCLFADLGIDPAQTGACSFEATDFLVHHRHADATTTIVLWQIGLIGEVSHKTQSDIWNPHGLQILIERLLETYPPDHGVVVYEAARLITSRPRIVRTPLRELATAPISPLSTLVIPPATQPVADLELYARLSRA
jgi:precorrin-6B methylase 1